VAKRLLSLSRQRSALVGEVGAEIYLSPKILDHGKGIELVSESNPLAVCRRPEALQVARMSAAICGGRLTRHAPDIAEFILGPREARTRGLIRAASRALWPQ
jgi:Phage major capsid protein E